MNLKTFKKRKQIWTQKENICRVWINLFFTPRGFPGGSDGKESACSAEDLGLIPGSERSPEEGNGNLLQYSWLRIPWTEKLVLESWSPNLSCTVLSSKIRASMRTMKLNAKFYEYICRFFLDRGTKFLLSSLW